MSENTNAQAERQPKNIFEQILFGMQVTNENIVAVHERMKDMEAKINEMYDAFNKISGPNVPGADVKK